MATDRGLADVTKFAVQASHENPTFIEPYVKAAGPTLVKIATAVDEAWPYVEKVLIVGWKIWKKLEPYKADFLPIIFGLILLFFGGSLPLTIAAFEAFRLCGWDKTKGAITTLLEQYKVAKEASDKDNLRDDNKDGIADIKQITAKQLLTRKVQLFFRVTDPVKVQDGISGIMAGVTAVAAVLRLKFAQTIALGTALGDLSTKTADQVLRPTLEHVVPKEYQKWIPFALSYACRSAAITFAWWCQRVISALHCSMRGSDKLLSGIFALLVRYHVKVPFNLSASHPLYPAGVGIISALGFYYQLSHYFGLPFPFNILLLPLRIMEGVLAWTLAYGPK